MPGFDALGPELIVWIVLVIAVSGFVQGALGMGFPMIATPLIALVTDMRSAIIIVLLPCLACVAASMARSGPLKPVLARFWMMPLGMLAGAAIGTRIFIAYPLFPYTLLLAAMIFVYLSMDYLGRAEWPVMQRHPVAFAAPFGLVAGMSEGTANVAAPPLVVYYLGLGLAPAALVQGLNICFFTGKVTQFGMLALFGGVGLTQWLATLPLAVIAIVTTLYGVTIRNRIDADTYRKWLKGALGAIAVMLFVQYLAGWGRS